MKRSILSVKFPETKQTGRVLVTDHIITRCSNNMRRWFGDSEEAFRNWCQEHKLDIINENLPEVETFIYTDGREMVEDEDVIIAQEEGL